MSDHKTQNKTDTSSTTVDPREVEKFAAMAQEWWEPEGKFKPLHKLNPTRLSFITDHISKHFFPNAPQKEIAGLSVLDVGCGGGLLCEPLARLGLDVKGIDATEINIEIAKEHARQSGLDISYSNIPLETLIQEDTFQQTGGYDIVIASEVIEHVASVPLFLESLKGAMKPGGLLILSTLNRTAKSYLFAIIGAEQVLKWLPKGTHDWKRFLSPEEIETQLTPLGLKIDHAQGMTLNLLKNSWGLSSDLNVNYILSITEDKHLS